MIKSFTIESKGECLSSAFFPLLIVFTNKKQKDVLIKAQHLIVAIVFWHCCDNI